MSFLSSFWNKEWLEENGFSLLARLLEFAFGMINFLILVRLFSREEFGAWALFISICIVAENVRSGLLQNSFIRLYNVAPPSRKKQLVSNSFALNVLLSVSFSLLLLLTENWWVALLNVPSLVTVVPLLAVVLIVGIPLFQINLYLLAVLKMRAYFYLNLIKVIAFSTAIFIHYFFEIPLSLEWLAIYFIGGAFFASLVVVFFNIKNSFPRISWDFIVVKKLLLFGRFVFLTNSLSSLKQNLDKFILSALLGPIAVAISNVAMRFVNVFEIPLQSIALVYYSKVTQQSNENASNKQAHFFYINLVVVFMVSLPLAAFVWIFAPQLITFFAGSEYPEAIDFLRIIIFAALLKPIDKLAGGYLDASGYPQQNTLSVIISFAAAIPVFWLFIVHYGINGAAIGFLAAQFLSSLIKVVFLKRAFGFQSRLLVDAFVQLFKQVFKF